MTSPIESSTDSTSPLLARIWTPWLTLLWSVLIFFIFSISQVAATFIAALGKMDPEAVQDLFIGGDQSAMESALYSMDLVWPAALASAVVGSLFLFLVIKIKRGLSITEYLNLQGARLPIWAMWLGITLVVGALLEYLASENPDLQTPFMKQVVENTESIPLFILSVGILAPVFEELFFRGFIFKGLERSFLGPHGTIWLTSIVFASIHLQYSIGVMFLIIPMGLVLGYSRYYSGSLLVPIGIHILNNTVAILLTMQEIHRGFSF